MPNSVLLVPESNSEGDNHRGHSDRITKLALKFQELTPDNLKQFPLTKRSLANELNSLSKDELIKLFDKFDKLTSGYPFLYALSGLSVQKFQVIIRFSAYPNYYRMSIRESSESRIRETNECPRIRETNECPRMDSKECQ